MAIVAQKTTHFSTRNIRFFTNYKYCHTWMFGTQKNSPHASVGVGLLVGREGLEPSTR